MAYVDREELLRPRLPEEDVEVEGLGTCKVRGLSRAEMHRVQGREDRHEPGVFERILLAIALVEPQLSEDDVAAWQQGSRFGEMEPVTAKAIELAGLGAQAAKDAYRRFEADPASEFRLPPGPDAGDDGPAAA